jgi:iron uptake system component EfeO
MIATAILAAACSAAPAASSGSTASIAVTVNTGGCSPATLSAKAGKVTFSVTNAGPEAGEFEVLSGTSVVGEVEDVVPGVPVSLSLDLSAGQYVLICYGDAAPRGSLTVAS